LLGRISRPPAKQSMFILHWPHVWRTGFLFSFQYWNIMVTQRLEPVRANSYGCGAGLPWLLRSQGGNYFTGVRVLLNSPSLHLTHPSFAKLSQRRQSRSTTQFVHEAYFALIAVDLRYSESRAASLMFRPEKPTLLAAAPSTSNGQNRTPRVGGLWLTLHWCAGEKCRVRR
jgi:hypothetical protein